MVVRGKGVNSNSTHRLANILLDEMIRAGANAVALEDADYIIQQREGDPERIRLVDKFGNHYFDLTSAPPPVGSHVPEDVAREFIRRYVQK